MQTVWTKRAETDLNINIAHIAKESPKNALKVLDEVLNLAENLKNMPMKFPKEPVYNKENIRFAVLFAFKIIYRVEKQKIYILRIFHTKQNPKKI